VRGTIGLSETELVLSDENLYGFDYDTTLRVTLDYGVLASASEDTVRTNRANLLYWGGVYLSFVTANPVDENTYDITGIIAGLRGSDNVASVTSEVRVVAITDNTGAVLSSVKRVAWDRSRLGVPVTYEIYSSANINRTSGDVDFIAQGNSLRALSVTPEIVKSPDGADGYYVVFYGRTRYPAGIDYFWNTGGAVRQSDPLSFRIRLYDGVDLVDTRVVVPVGDDSGGRVTVNYTEAELTSAFGSVPLTLTGDVVQNGIYGQGQLREFKEI
jgi:hypothetical protein